MESRCISLWLKITMGMVSIAQECGEPLTNMNDWNSKALSITDALLPANVEPNKHLLVQRETVS